MELFAFTLALACSIIAYYLEQKWWVTLLRTTDKLVFLAWKAYLDEAGIEYKTRIYKTLNGDALQTVYLLKVPAQDKLKSSLFK
ncbi:hypothetical protein ACI7RC_17415 [Brevibacillus sp. B_LB10_24]|uniref:hypothetical protein n=1 Tax=Brevibacillus sp. B_LB10_24 TaxID=3380645 RepID=UPI0038B762CE